MAKVERLPPEALPKVGDLFGFPVLTERDLLSAARRMSFETLDVFRCRVPFPAELESQYRSVVKQGAIEVPIAVSQHAVAVASILALAELIFVDHDAALDWWVAPRQWIGPNAIPPPVVSAGTLSGANELISVLRKTIHGIF